MTIKRRVIEGLILDTDHDLGNTAGAQTVKLGLGAPYAKLLAIRARNYASSAKAAAGTDTACKLRITDADGVVKYLDGTDRDYATAKVHMNVSVTEDVTGTGEITVNTMGTAPGANEGASGGPVLKSPVLVAVVNGATATDYMVVELDVEV